MAYGIILKHLVYIHTFSSQDTMKWLNYIVHTVIFSTVLHSTILKSHSRNHPRRVMCAHDYNLLCTGESCWFSLLNPTHLNETMLKYYFNFCRKVKTKYNLATSDPNPSRSRNKSTISMLKNVEKGT